MIRLLRLLKTETNASSALINRLAFFFKVNYGVAQLIKVFVLVLFANHIMACIWFYSARLNNFDPDTWVFRFNYVDADSIT